MERDEYFRFLHETSEPVNSVIRKYVESFRNTDRSLYDILMLFIRRRINKPLLKPSLLRLSYEVCGGIDWEAIISVAAAFELINISSYQANSAFDDKLGILTKSQKDSQFIGSMITRELSQIVVSELIGKYNKQIINEIYDSLSKSNYYVYLAQHYDLNILNLQNYETYQDEKLFLKHYINRCFYGSGIFNGQCAYMGALLVSASHEQLNALKNFGENFGTALQIINDIGDFVPPNMDSVINRDFQDQYSDFKNGRLTLPLYHLLRFGSFPARKCVKDIIHNELFDDKSLLKVTQFLLEEGAIHYAKEKAREYIKKAEKNLKKFEKCRSKQLLLIMLSIILTNKYLFVLKKISNNDDANLRNGKTKVLC